MGKELAWDRLGPWAPYLKLSQPLVTGQKTSYATGDDGDLELGLSRGYTVLTTGQYSGTSNIVINGKTHALSNNCVQDNKTGLMWARYVPTADIGPAAERAGQQNRAHVGEVCAHGGHRAGSGWTIILGSMDAGA